MSRSCPSVPVGKPYVSLTMYTAKGVFERLKKTTTTAAPKCVNGCTETEPKAVGPSAEAGVGQPRLRWIFDWTCHPLADSDVLQHLYFTG